MQDQKIVCFRKTVAEKAQTILEINATFEPMIKSMLEFSNSDQAMKRILQHYQKSIFTVLYSDR